MFAEIENILEGNKKEWKALGASLNNGARPLETALNLVRAQIKRAQNPMLTGGFSRADKADNDELIANSTRNIHLDHEENPECQVDGLRNFYSMERSHLRLTVLGDRTTDEDRKKLEIIEKFLALLPPEPKVYPSEHDKPKELQPAGFFQEKS